MTTPDREQALGGYAASEIGGLIAKLEAEYEEALATLSIEPDVSSLDELSRSIFGAMQDCPAMSSDKIADFIARALWPKIEALGGWQTIDTVGPSSDWLLVVVRQFLRGRVSGEDYVSIGWTGKGGSDDWCLLNPGSDEDQVIYWMPLPPAPVSTNEVGDE